MSVHRVKYKFICSVIAEKSISKKWVCYTAILYLYLFVSLTLFNCKGEEKSSPSEIIGLLIAYGNQMPSISEGTNEGDGVLPPIPPVVGPPALPGQPQNAPILNLPQTQVGNALVVDDPHGFYGRISIFQISFQQPVHNQTTITAYIGKRNMKLEQDGTVVNATNFSTLTPANPNGGAFSFNFNFPSDQKQKLILLARNEFGISSKEIDFSHNRNCIGAPLLPNTIGDCDQHCFEIINIAGHLEFKSKLKHDVLTYVELDFSGFFPLTGAHYLIPNFFSYVLEPGDLPLQPGVISVATVLNQEGYHASCLELQTNYVSEDENGNFNTDIFHRRVRLE
ncbi:hypothetical protein EHO98_10005 [Leptospira stimsonii]|uniref:Lipoprotein n=1 Tax=Leptospira stimsonii TaxID=2202203 RepID=A0ABY2N4S5_9LEPT|nr:hypothetical protein EHO98_10005 [Leptospira stimsonii]TGM17139.1 hypothetical protein EHQ90_08175 [Leptospira stimsonii]